MISIKKSLSWIILEFVTVIVIFALHPFVSERIKFNCRTAKDCFTKKLISNISWFYTSRQKNIKPALSTHNIDSELRIAFCLASAVYRAQNLHQESKPSHTGVETMPVIDKPIPNEKRSFTAKDIVYIQLFSDYFLISSPSSSLILQ